LKKCIYSTYSPLSSTHTYDFVVLTSLNKKKLLVVLQIGKAKDLSAPLRTVKKTTGGKTCVHSFPDPNAVSICHNLKQFMQEDIKPFLCQKTCGIITSLFKYIHILVASSNTTQTHCLSKPAPCRKADKL
jgi:uncharacterized protein YifN (PemK superfamily)